MSGKSKFAALGKALSQKVPFQEAKGNGQASQQENEPSGFADCLSDVDGIKPLTHELKAADLANENEKPKSLKLDKAKNSQRESALGLSQGLCKDSLQFLESLPPEKHLPQDPMGFKQPGLQDGVYKKLRTGRYEVETKLDLHGFRVKEALSITLNFIAQTMLDQKRCALISHGKGIKQQEQARLKNHLAAWLKHMPNVMAYHSALPQHGGTGCVYVLLKKSEQKKQENRERFINVKSKK